MNSRENSKYLFLLFVSALVLLMMGDVYAQHEGGLGTKKVHLNIADKDQLMKIEGMTNDIAESILEYREKTGFFKKPEDLLNVPGITKDVYEKMNPQTGSEGDLFCVPIEGDLDEEDDEDIPLAPSKC
ncbi:MAG: helix-hairpin-helix domain-containing protein [Deltaproteobacteria bacterium]|nr:helix-hairpin-helix domain-containing protein [Deltaproteobacteria bacterium]